MNRYCTFTHTFLLLTPLHTLSTFLKSLIWKQDLSRLLENITLTRLLIQRREIAKLPTMLTLREDACDVLVKTLHTDVSNI